MPLILLAIGVRDAGSVVIYRLGIPFSTVEKDSFHNTGIEFVEIDWSVLQLAEALEVDSLQAGSLQPNFIDDDEDIAATLLDRGGRVWIDVFGAPYSLIAQPLIDGDSSTDYTWFAVAPEAFAAGNIRTERFTANLGGEFLVREVRFRPLPEKPQHFLEHFELGVADREALFRGERATPLFPVVIEVRENTEPEVVLRLNPPVNTSAIQLRVFRQTAKEIGLADFEVFSGGFVNQAFFESDVLAIPDIASFGEIRWSGREDPGARVETRTRSGADLHPEIFWETRTEQQDSVRFLQGGGDLTLTEYKRHYDRLSDEFKPELPQDRISVDVENWSFWSSPYVFEHPGVDIVSPSPGQFIQLKADFSSTIEDGGKIDFIEFAVSVPPAVRRLVGEIFPIETTVGKVTDFTYYIRPDHPLWGQWV